MVKYQVKTGILVTLFVCILLLVTSHACMTFRMSSKEIDSYFSKNNINGSQHSTNQRIHYIKAGDPNGPLVLFVHGSPGSLSAFIHFLNDTLLNQKLLLISTDRPGFGYSDFGMAQPSLSKQAAALAPILKDHKNNRPIILVGHSLGGPLVGRIAMDYPDLVDGLILVAPSIDPALEPNETWWRAPFATPFLSWVLPRSLRASNEEIYQLKPQLEDMLTEWAKITCPVIVIQGEKDSLVAPGNADFAKAKLVNAQVDIIRKPEMNHFVPWTNPELIREAILKLATTQPAYLSGN
ncbi:MAG: alpha/beta hydrolase [Cyclobacteriaceae bacterium]|nr:alpha/beta hydrolase [Cyclobacteriaceae bacterium]